ncbi:putative adipose-regulatory protein-domain-containing protein [Chlamydoabsidia padenii]|nr:putative adipose-regulatory protein-domain-containing protein [Chlamydoabsidia padenii]
MGRSTSTEQGHGGSFHVVPSYENSSDVSVDDQSSLGSRRPSNSIDEPLDDIPPIEWHPALLTVFTIIQRLTAPVCRVVFAPRAQRTIIKSTITLVVFGWILLTSIAAYFFFYQQYVPLTLHSQPIFFQYGPIDQRNQVAPKGIIDLTGGYNKMPLRHEQVYNVFLQLHVPTSDINFDLGNFMVDVELLSNDDLVVSQSSRPAILRYQSPAQRHLHVISKALPLLAGLTEESQVIIIPLIENYIEQKAHPVVRATITLSNPTLQIYDAQFGIRADFRGLRYYMYHHRIPTATTFIVMFMLIELVFATMAWKSFGQNLWFAIRDLFEEAALEQQQQQQLHNEEDQKNITT